MIKKFDFYLFSPNYFLAKKLFYLGNLKAIFFETRCLNKDIYNFSKLHNIPLFLIDNLKDLDEKLQIANKENSIGISYGIGIFFKNRHIEKFEYGIWNIHGGKLPENRGRHPISYSFINNDKYFTLSIHAINEEIDQGYLIHEAHIERDINDNQKDILNKFDRCIEGDYLDIAIENYFNNKLIELGKGNYNPNLCNKFNNINSKEFTSQELFSIFKSQIMYGPVCINDKKYVSCDFYHEYFVDENVDLVECKDCDFLCLKKEVDNG